MRRVALSMISLAVREGQLALAIFVAGCT